MQQSDTRLILRAPQQRGKQHHYEYRKHEQWISIQQCCGATHRTCISYVTEGCGIVCALGIHLFWSRSSAKRPLHWWWPWRMATSLGLSHDMMVCSKLCAESSGSSIGKFYRGDPPGGRIASTRLTNVLAADCRRPLCCRAAVVGYSWM
jgi:hypothetical protein